MMMKMKNTKFRKQKGGDNSPHGATKKPNSERGIFMNNVEKILMERDGLTEQEATDTLKCTMEMVQDAIDEGEFFDAEDIFCGELGLEPDYLLDMLI